ncbi:kila N-terminal domain N1R/P28 DNA binding protein [Acanthamoeba polyphaga mimivirus]|uniref:Kila N-terminal domain N1R/P28 DNA binding protein n=1 Tax=Acanthamoeba polyphaga mimivirus Kroon TaxID=3069720 RepID=A0A0G2Y206_9VIRU|nr:kila N-terminal domain N1R/P28 DNA binding protein [Acanthamoeba polyphaga mimivirus]AKI79760.1 kila N-terminal domain N1R/P28 DNA binding protein [Acanthamoeba polyphaga mimivirus Kroon]
MNVQKSSKKPLKKSVSKTSEIKSGSKNAKTINSKNKLMKSTKSSSKSNKKVHEKIYDNESSDNESSDNESSDNESSDNESSDNESSDNESSVESSDGGSEYEIKKPKRMPSQYSKKFTDNMSDDESDNEYSDDDESDNEYSDDDESDNEYSDYDESEKSNKIYFGSSKKIAVMVSDIINEHFTKKIFDKHEQLIKCKDDKIAELIRKIDKQTILIKDQKSIIKKQNKKINELLSKSNEVLGYTKDTNRKNTYAVKKSFPYSDEHKIENQLIIMKNNNKPIKPKKGEIVKKIYDYTALIIMNESKSVAMNRYCKDHPNGETVLTIDYTPNAMYLWNQCKEELIEDEKIKSNETSCSSFNLRKEYSEGELIEDIKRIHNSNHCCVIYYP